MQFAGRQTQTEPVNGRFQKSRRGDESCCPVRRERGSAVQETFFDYCRRTGQDVLLEQWIEAKNAPLTPEQVGAGSHRKVWWRCEKGHEWQAMVKSRTAGSGCPVCAHRTVARGETDLAATYPELAAQWHPTRNGTLTPRDVLPGTQQRVWWQCGKGHEWQARVSARTYGGTGCPVCSNKTVSPGENDLATLCPELAGEWHPEKNGTLTPEQVTPYSNRKVWWRCPQGHSYQAVIATRTSHNSGCPYCSRRKVLPGFNDLATLYPDLAAQWHPTLNGNLTPEMITPGSHKRVWWQCSRGHVWRAVVYPRTGRKKCGCPVCAGVAKAHGQTPKAEEAEQKKTG